MKGRALFPIGLHASILLALLCLFSPTTWAICEGWGGAIMSLPLRALAVILPRFAEAATTDTGLAEASRKVAALRARQMRMHAEVPDAIANIGGLQPVLCQVIDRKPRAVEWPWLLTLDRSWAELAGCERYVTAGASLLGFLTSPEPGESLDAPARVALLNDQRRGGLPRRVAAQVMLNAKERLRFLVEPASTIDQWPLRCTLLDDPYLAAGVQRTDLEVLTIEVDDPLGTVPAGLSIGRMRPWGYRRSKGGFTPIDLYVQPGVNSQFVSMVSLWRKGAAKPVAPTAPLSGGKVWPVRTMRLPVTTSAAERWYASFRWDTPMFRAGAALLHGERLLGRVVSSGPGHAFVRPFGQPGAVWAVTMLPELSDASPVDLWVVCEQRGASQSRLRILSGDLSGLRGDLYTGAMSEDCPPGLWIGPVEVLATKGQDPQLIVRHPVLDPALSFAIYQRVGVAR